MSDFHTLIQKLIDKGEFDSLRYSCGELSVDPHQLSKRRLCRSWRGYIDQLDSHLYGEVDKELAAAQVALTLWGLGLNDSDLVMHEISEKRLERNLKSWALALYWLDVLLWAFRDETRLVDTNNFDTNINESRINFGIWRQIFKRILCCFSFKNTPWKRQKNTEKHRLDILQDYERRRKVWRILFQSAAAEDFLHPAQLTRGTSERISDLAYSIDEINAIEKEEARPAIKATPQIGYVDIAGYDAKEGLPPIPSFEVFELKIWSLLYRKAGL